MFSVSQNRGPLFFCVLKLREKNTKIPCIDLDESTGALPKLKDPGPPTPFPDVSKWCAKKCEMIKLA